MHAYVHGMLTRMMSRPPLEGGHLIWKKFRHESRHARLGFRPGIRQYPPVSDPVSVSIRLKSVQYSNLVIQHPNLVIRRYLPQHPPVSGQYPLESRSVSKLGIQYPKLVSATSIQWYPPVSGSIQKCLNFGIRQYLPVSWTVSASIQIQYPSVSASIRQYLASIQTQYPVESASISSITDAHTGLIARSRVPTLNPPAPTGTPLIIILA